MTTALERGLVDAFAGDATLNGLISGRLYPLVLPDSNRAFPAVVYQVIDNPRQYSQQGDTGTTFARVQFRFYATTYQECCNLRDAFVTFCATHQVPPNTSFGSPAVILAGWFVENESDDTAPAFKDSGGQLFSKRLDATIHTTDL